MLMSVDGKITTGASDELDVDKNFPCIKGVKEGLHQYYELEQMTDLWSFNTGRVQKKLGVNEKEFPSKSPVSFVLLDNHHLTEHGVRIDYAKSCPSGIFRHGRQFTHYQTGFFGFSGRIKSFRRRVWL